MTKSFFYFLFIVIAVEATAQTSGLIPVAPANGGTVNPNRRMLFTWSPPMPVTGAQTHKIKIVEIVGDQSPEQAIRTNKPIFEKDTLAYIRGNKPFFEKDSMIYVTAGAPFTAGKRYAWNVQVLNREGKPIGGNNGTSEVFSFRTANGATPVKSDAVQRRQK